MLVPDLRGGVDRAPAQEVEPVAPWHLRLRPPLRFGFPERAESHRQNGKSTVAGGADETEGPVRVLAVISIGV